MLALFSTQMYGREEIPSTQVMDKDVQEMEKEKSSQDDICNLLPAVYDMC
jgi:hypothetical protein